MFGDIDLLLIDYLFLVILAIVGSIRGNVALKLEVGSSCLSLLAGAEELGLGAGCASVRVELGTI